MAVKKTIPVDVIEKAKLALAATPAKPAKLVDDALEDLKPVLLDLEKKGYSRQEIVVLLAQEGIEVGEHSIKKVLATKRAEKTASA